MTMNPGSQPPDAHRVNDPHVRPLEQAHKGEYALVTPDGRAVFAPTLLDVMQRAHERANPGNYIFKVGDVALGRL